MVALAAVLGLAFVPIADAFAQAYESAATLKTHCDAQTGLTNKVVECISFAVRSAGDAFFSEFFTFLAVGIGATVTLGIALMGVMITAGGLERPSRDGIVFVIKVSIAGFVLGSMPQIYDMVLAIIQGFMEVVTNFSNANFALAHCEPPATLWDRVDCMFAILIGYDGNGIPKLSSGMTGFFFQSLGAGVQGTIVGIAGLYVIIKMLFGIVKALFVYLFALIGLVFMMMIGPIFIPLILFRAGKQYFDHYLKVIISLVLQPVILFGYLVFMVIAIDALIYSSDVSLMKQIAGDGLTDTAYQVDNPATGVKRFDLGKYIAMKNEDVKNAGGALCGKDDEDNVITLVNDNFASRAYIDKKQDEPATAVKAITSMPLFPSTAVRLVDKAMDDKKDDKTLGIELFKKEETLNYECLAKVRTPALPSSAGSGGTMGEYMSIKMLIMAAMMFVLVSMLGYIPTMANDLAGGLYQTPDLHKEATKNLPGADSAAKGADALSAGVSRMVSGRLGLGS